MICVHIIVFDLQLHKACIVMIRVHLIQSLRNGLLRSVFVLRLHKAYFALNCVISFKA